MFRRFLKNNFSGYQWCRKYLGGYWECWYIDVIHGNVWFNISKYKAFNGFRPGCGFGTPYCEYYPLEFFDYKTKFDKPYFERQLKLERICK